MYRASVRACLPLHRQLVTRQAAGISRGPPLLSLEALSSSRTNGHRHIGAMLFSSSSRLAAPLSSESDAPPAATEMTANLAQISQDTTSLVEAAAASASSSPPELTNSLPDLALQLFDLVHTTTATPWWLSLAIGTVALRVTLLPVSLYALIHSRRLQAMKPKLEVLQAEINQKMAQMADPKEAKIYRSKMQDLFREHKTNPFKSFVGPIVQMPVFISVFMALRKSSEYFPDLATQGALWFPDLTVSDPYYVLPIISAASMLLIFEVGAEGQSTQQMGQMKNIMRVMAVASAPLTAWMPASVFVYWITSNVFALSQTAVLKIKPVQNWLGVPDAPAPAGTPLIKPQPAAVPQPEVVSYRQRPPRFKRRGDGNS